MSIKAVCFDLGGVLVRICYTWPQALKRAGFEQMGDLTTLDQHQEFARFQAGALEDAPYLDFLGAQLGGLTAEQAKTVHNAILIEPYPQTSELVQEIEANGLQTGCLSNTNTLHAREMFATTQYPAIARLQTQVLSHIVKASKPDPAIYRAFETAAGLGPHEILNFDDVMAYTEAAKQAGWNAVRIDPTSDTAAQMRSALVTFGLL